MILSKVVLVILCARLYLGSPVFQDRSLKSSSETLNQPRFVKGVTSFFGNFFTYFQLGLKLLMGGGGGTEVKEKAVVKVETRSAKVMYNNFQLWRVVPQTSGQLASLENVAEEMPGVQFWTQPMKNQTTDVLVPPKQIQKMRKYLTKQKMEFSILIKDLQNAIASQNPKVQKAELKGNQLHDMTFKRYHRYGDMLNYFKYLTTMFPNMVEVMTIGKSSQGRPLRVVKISSGIMKNGDPKPIVWIDGGMHAREWISPAVVMYTIKQLVENFKGNKKIVEGADWYLLPVANPDGYEYSHTTDRLWRKTRSGQGEDDEEDEDEKEEDEKEEDEKEEYEYKEEDDDEEDDDDDDDGIFRRRRSRSFRRRGRLFWESTCAGVDLNRNWGFHWGERGASDDPCHETYAGPKAFSEPETRAISDFIMDRKDRVQLYLTMHAYSQMWLIPWGYTSKKVGDYDDMMSMGKKAVNAIARNGGTRYDLGSSTSLMYPTSGASDDWAKGVAGIKYAYTVELRDKGSFGFMLPANQIIPTGKETFAAIKALATAIVCKV